MTYRIKKDRPTSHYPGSRIRRVMDSNTKRLWMTRWWGLSGICPFILIRLYKRRRPHYYVEAAVCCFVSREASLLPLCLGWTVRPLLSRSTVIAFFCPFSSVRWMIRVTYATPVHPFCRYKIFFTSSTDLNLNLSLFCFFYFYIPPLAQTLSLAQQLSLHVSYLGRVW